MRKIIPGAVAVAATTAAPSAYALENFDFSITADGKTTTGEILGLVFNAQSRPTDVIIDSAPYGKAGPYNMFPASNMKTSGAFTLSYNRILGASYRVRGDFSGAFYGVYFNGWTSSSEPHRNGFRQAGGSATTGGGGVDGAVYINTTLVPAGGGSSVPEPASIALLGAGLVGISAFRRRRAAV